MDKIILTKKQAKSLLIVGARIHTFRNINGMLLGVDWSRKAILKAIDDTGENELEIGGDMCKRLEHALIIHTNGYLFVESNMDKVAELEKVNKDKENGKSTLVTTANERC